MSAGIDAATAAFLTMARSDLQRQLPRAGRVDDIIAAHGPNSVDLTALVTVGNAQIRFIGSGESLLDAYAALVQAAPKAVLEEAHRQELERPPS